MPSPRSRATPTPPSRSAAGPPSRRRTRSAPSAGYPGCGPARRRACWCAGGCAVPEVLYTSDLHIGHQKVAGIRGFATTEEHDLAMAELWRAQVQPDDQVWILGDLSLNMAAGLDWIA